MHDNTFRNTANQFQEHFFQINIFIILCNRCEFNFDSIFNDFFELFFFILINKRTRVVQIALIFENRLPLCGIPYLPAASNFALRDAGISGGGGRGMPKPTLTPS